MTYDAVVVGAGLSGISVAYWLHQYGMKHLVVVDQALLGAGSSGRGVGIVSLLHDTAYDIALARQSLNFYRYVAERSQGILRLRDYGLLRLSYSSRTREALRKLLPLYRSEGLSATFLSPDEVIHRWPWLRHRDLQGALWSVEDAYVDGAAYLYALYLYLKSQGVKFSLLNVVEGLHVEGETVRGVLTEEGLLEAPRVVLATGAWTGLFLEWVGLRLPIATYKTQAGVVVFPLPLEAPMLHDLDTGVYARPENPTHWIVGDGTEFEAPDTLEERPANTAFVEQVATVLPDRVQVADQAGFVRGWTGPCVATPDRRPLAGPLPGVEGLWVIVGMNGLGFMRAPAVGQLVAALMTGMEPRVDPAPLAPDRFPPDKPFTPREGFMPEALL